MLYKAEKNEAPILVHNDLRVTSSVLRDLISEKVEKIVVDSKEDYKRITKKWLKKMLRYWRCL